MKKILMIAAPLVLIALTAMGVGSWQAMQKLQTLPVYSLKVIRESAENHDAETFYKLVDAEKILKIAAEEIVTAKINDGVNSMIYSTLELANTYENLREEFIEAATPALSEYVSTGKINFPEYPTEIQKWLKKSGVDTCTINNYSTPVISDGAAYATVNFHNGAMNFDFEVEVTMQKLNDTEWKIIDAKGFEGYYLGVKRALKIKLESLNTPVREKIAQTFDVKRYAAEIAEGDEYGFSKTLKISLETEFFTDKPIEKIIGRVILDGRDDNAGITPFEIEINNVENGLQTFEINKILNPFVKQDSDIMKHGFRKNTLHVEVTEIDYLDGTRLKQIDKLPDWD